MWLVRQELPPTSTSSKESKKSPYSFRGRFTKDIHVSPFMPLGWYTVDTSDPCAPSKPGQLDILVTLTSPEGKPLMVARVASSQPGLDASRASMWEKISFLVRWWYVATCTVMTYRILSEAARIYFVKATQYWTRREPPRTALGRPARTVERYEFLPMLRAAYQQMEFLTHIDRQGPSSETSAYSYNTPSRTIRHRYQSRTSPQANTARSLRSSTLAPLPHNPTRTQQPPLEPWRHPRHHHAPQPARPPIPRTSSFKSSAQSSTRGLSTTNPRTPRLRASCWTTNAPALLGRPTRNSSRPYSARGPHQATRKGLHQLLANKPPSNTLQVAPHGSGLCFPCSGGLPQPPTTERSHTRLSGVSQTWIGLSCLAARRLRRGATGERSSACLWASGSAAYRLVR